MADPVASATADALLTFARCFGLKAASTVYVSTPITTGREYLKWRASTRGDTATGPKSDAQHREQVMAKNIVRAADVVNQVRSHFDRPVVDPTQLHVDGWGQFDYHSFWVELIERFASTIVFVEGWEYSSGAALEFMAGYRSNRVLLTQDLQELRPAKALSLLREAIKDFQHADLDAPILVQVADQLASSLRPNHAAEV